MGLMAFDRSRLEVLRTALDAALEDLHLIRSDDVNAADAMRDVRSASRIVGDSCMPRVHDILTSTAMTWYRRAGAACDNPIEAAFVTAHERGWETTSIRSQCWGHRHQVAERSTKYFTRCGPAR